MSLDRFWCLSVQDVIGHLLQQLDHLDDVSLSSGSLVFVRGGLWLRGRHVVLTRQVKLNSTDRVEVGLRGIGTRREEEKRQNSNQRPYSRLLLSWLDGGVTIASACICPVSDVNSSGAVTMLTAP
jgi:hypothetical protein